MVRRREHQLMKCAPIYKQASCTQGSQDAREESLLSGLGGAVISPASDGQELFLCV